MSIVEKGLIQDEAALTRDWEAVGSYLRQAMEEAATEIGNEAERHVLERMGEDILPDPAVLIYLERRQPGIADWIIARSAEIQRETHQRELAEANNLRRKVKAFGKRMLWLT